MNYFFELFERGVDMITNCGEKPIFESKLNIVNV
jgi:hypothetical protein